ncbi:MAG TPA: choice-of-anchor Q domain-containing protein, partial [Polyangiaceae bacterium]|nr:choice-of-anchor Q domain-containing protein [Polyangiaceae bacterium]
ASVLRDRIPTNNCSTAVDARGITRPQGPACDIGAVEIAPAPGTGPTDLALSFTNPPALAVAGQEATWQVTLANHGSAGSMPAVEIDVPAGVTITEATATGSAICSTADPVLCIWSGALAQGSSVTITLKAQVGSQVTGALLWSARVLAPDLQPPLTDDRAELTTPTRVDSGVSMTLRFRRDTDNTGQRVSIASVWLNNGGPSNALGTSTQPIEVLFHPAPGVTATPLGENRLLGSFAPGDAFATVEFAIGVAGALPARLGSLELRPGANPQAPVPAIEVFAADLELRGFRASGVQAPGTPLAFRYEVTNNGPATAPATQLEVSIDTASYTWTPSRGTVEPSSSGPQAVVWRIGALAPGETATLNGSVTGADDFSSPWVYLSSEAIDFNGENERATLNLGPAPDGTADLRISDVQVSQGPSADQRQYRVTIANAGPASAGSAENRLEFVLEGQSEQLVSIQAAPGFECGFGTTSASCYSAGPLAAGATATFEFVRQGPFRDGQYRPYVDIRAPFGTPDPNPQNNFRYLGAPSP